ncbi:hypothetical protein KC19_VG215900 [Ceratodon purpureus]|uniref:Uncharacterized protein n=1 Tax=Ceratodon purpureus TaxID=3225 RepID=A0A8T0HS76_CERPU|nr:hypothetical protein KC19_VG215900 [Ceratodon purpureus]
MKTLELAFKDTEISGFLGLKLLTPGPTHTFRKGAEVSDFLRSAPRHKNSGKPRHASKQYTQLLNLENRKGKQWKVHTS